VKRMTLPEWFAALRAFADFHGGAKEGPPSDAALYAFYHDTAPRGSIVH